MHDWIMIDDATHQHVRQIGKDTFELIELNAYPPNDLFEVYTDIICLSDYPEAERAMILRFFGYASPKQVLEEYGESANQIIAECVFEHYSSFALESMATGLTREDAQIFIEQYIRKERDANENNTPCLPRWSTGRAASDRHIRNQR